jgi:hypothetical protein
MVLQLFGGAFLCSIFLKPRNSAPKNEQDAKNPNRKGKTVTGRKKNQQDEKNSNRKPKNLQGR